MGTLKAEGIVLRHADYRDHDRMLLLLTPDHGLVDALCRGCRRPKSPLLPAGQCFSQGEYMFFRNRDRYTVTACSLLSVHYSLRQEPYRLTCASYMAGLCRAAAQPGEPAPELYALLLWGLNQLASAEDETFLLVITSAFLLRYADVTGYRPRLNHCANCAGALSPPEGAAGVDPRAPVPGRNGGAASGPAAYSLWWDVQAGGLVCGNCADKESMRLTGAQAAWMRGVLARGAEALSAILPPDPAGAPGVPANEKALFVALKRYVESRLETTLKVSKMLP